MRKKMNDYPFGARYNIFVVYLNFFANVCLCMYPTPSWKLLNDLLLTLLLLIIAVTYLL